MQEFKIFFSWQSDLSSNKTTRFIDECLESVVNILKDTITVKPDRATQDMTGSPDITESIFSKIDECDLFIADLSIINNKSSMDEQQNPDVKYKLTPNPNVLLETGYAARALGWDRIICLFNQEFGNPDDFPFDIDHRRLTPYQFTQSTRENEKNKIVQIIAGTVIQFMTAGGVQRKGKSYFRVGGYNYKKHTVLKTITPFNIKKSTYYQNEKQSIINECLSIYNEISNIELPLSTDNITDTNTDMNNSSPFAKLSLLGKPSKKELMEDEKETIKELIKIYLDTDIDDSFFDLGSLQVRISLIERTTEYEGTDSEKRKITLIENLESRLLSLQLMELYAKTFDNIIIIPLAIHNDSNELDKNVTVNIHIIDDGVETIFPTKDLFNQEYKSDDEYTGLEGIVYDEGYVKNFLKMNEDSHIHYENNVFNKAFNPDRIKTPIMTANGFGMPDSDADDYEYELQTYVKNPIENGKFQYSISYIRPNETMWLGPVMMLKSKQNKITLTYSIISENTNGDLQGEIEIENTYE